MKNVTSQTGGKKKLVWKIILAVFLLLAAAQTIILGVLGGMGPLGFIRDNRIKNLPGNGPEYDFSALEPMEESPLKGKSVILLGSSVARGETSDCYAVGEYLTARLGCTVVKETVSGTTLVDNGENSYVQRMLNNLDPNAPCDLFICQLSTNDATLKKELGEISDSTDPSSFDTSTVTGAMEYIISYAQSTWGCPVVFFTGSRYDNSAYEAMVQRLLELQDKWDVEVLDLWTSDGFNDITDEARALYMCDNIHPTKAGYRDWWGPEQERQLLEILNG